MTHEIRSLPRDIMVQIFAFLRPKDIFSALLVCKHWSKLKDDKVLLETIHLKILEEKFVWDPRNSHSLTTLSEDKRTVFCNTSSWVTARAKIEFTKGQHYFEIILEKMNGGFNTWKAVIGVGDDEINYTKTGRVETWGHVAAEGRRVCFNHGSGWNYSTSIKAEDVVGVFVDMEEHALSFFVNGLYRGVAFVNLPSKVYPAVSLTWSGDCAKLHRLCLLKSEWPMEVKEIVNGATYQEDIKKMKSNPEEQWQFRSSDRMFGDSL